MSKIIGVTVGTPTSPSKIAKQIKPVKTVNGKSPDETGNLTLETDFATDEEVTQLLEAIYGDPAENLPEDDIPIVDSDFATDKEVEDMLNDIFGD